MHTITFSAIGTVDINIQAIEPFTATSPFKNMAAFSTALEDFCIEDDAENQTPKATQRLNSNALGCEDPGLTPDAANSSASTTIMRYPMSRPRTVGERSFHG
ncbi:MAG: hypothetical protein WAM97_14070 [Acidimicrobiales bacterium]